MPELKFALLLSAEARLLAMARRLAALDRHLVTSTGAASSDELLLWKPDLLPPGPGTGNPFFRPVNQPPEGAAGLSFNDMQAIGLQHCTFPSAAFGCEVGYCVYLPPGYDTDTDGPPLPVIYNLHVSQHPFQCAQCRCAACCCLQAPLLRCCCAAGASPCIISWKQP